MRDPKDRVVASGMLLLVGWLVAKLMSNRGQDGVSGTTRLSHEGFLNKPSSGAAGSQSASGGVADARTAMTAWTGVVVGVLAPIVILLSRWPTLGLAATLVFVFAGLGPGITCQIDTGDPYAQAALTFVLGMAEFALAATIMIWLADWHPTWLLALAVPSVLSCLYRLHAGHVASTVSGAPA